MGGVVNTLKVNILPILIFLVFLSTVFLWMARKKKKRCPAPTTQPTHPIGQA